MFSSFRKLIVLLQLLSLVSPLLRRGRGLSLPFLMKEIAFFALTNSDMFWKLLEKRNWSPEAIKQLLKFRGKGK